MTDPPPGALAGQVAGTTTVQKIDDALEGLDESVALEVLDAACVQAGFDGKFYSVDPQYRPRVDSVYHQLVGLKESYDENGALQA